MSRLIDKETIENVKRLHREGVPRKEIARRVWVSLSSVYRILNDLDPNEETMVKSDRKVREEIQKLHKEGVSRKHISEMLGVSLFTVYRTVPTTQGANYFTRVEGDKACTYKLIKVEPLKDVLEERGAVGIPVQCQESPKPLNPFECFNQAVKAITDQATNFASTHKVSIAPRQKASVIVEGYIDMLVKSYAPAIPLEFQEGIKARAMNTFRGFSGNLMEMATKAVNHSIKEAAIR